MRKIGLGLMVLLVWGCLGVPQGVQPVNGFDLDRYLGTWYEIARLDHSFERGLDQVTATYSLREDGGIRVVNRGFESAENRWKEAVGKAVPAGAPGEGYLKVSFFGPFYGSYVIFELDQAYQYAFVCGPNPSYLWLLARTPTVSQSVTDAFVAQAKSLGFDTEALIFVNQTGHESITP